MTRRFLPIVGFGLLATLIAVVALVVAPERRDLILDVYVLALGGIAVVRFVHLTQRPLGPGERSEFEDVLHRSAQRAVRVAERDKLAREVQLGTQTAFDLHYRLRPTVAEIARNRLAGRGIPLESERARAALGDEAYDFVRPDREPPRNRNAPGIQQDQLERLVAALERIA